MKKTNIQTKNQKKPASKKQVNPETRKTIVWTAGIILFTTFVFSPVFNNKPTNFDDVVYVTENPYIINLSFQNIGKIFSEFYYGGYYPLTLLSFATDYAISGGNPSFHILVNFLFHLANTLLLFWIVVLIFKNRTVALISALLFAVHTLHVESVAWISERKDVLYAFFYFLSLIIYLKYIEKQKIKYLIISMILFLMSVLSKTMAVALVGVLPLLDWFYGRKWLSRKVLMEKIPFVLIAVIFGIIAIKSQSSIGAIAEETTLPLLQRIVFAGYAFTMYLVKLLYPFHLSAFYPYPVQAGAEISALYWLFLLPPVGVLALTVFLFRKVKEYALLLSFFILNIVLVLQLIQINDFVMADRFVYVASAGIFILIALFFNRLSEKFPLYKNTVTFVLTGYIAILSYLTYQRTDIWQNSISLWTDVTEKYPQVYRAWDKLGMAKADEEQNYPEAINALNKALELNPEFYQSYINRGNIKATLGDLNGALDDFNKAISIKPDYYSAYNNRGATYAQAGKIEEALSDFNKCLNLNPEYSKAYCNRGLAYLNLKNYEKAIEDFNKCIKISPLYYPAYNFRALVYVRMRNLNEALKDLDKCLSIQPDFPDGLYNRGVLRLQLNQKQSACEDLAKAAQLGHPKAENMVQTYCN